MDVKQQKMGAQHLIWDAERVPQIRIEYFSPAYWEANNAIVGVAGGRGQTLFLRNGRVQWVLRHYRRGGLIGRFIQDTYWRGSVRRTRAMREWRLLQKLQQQQLPAPAPVAARVKNRGLIYRADLITERIEQARPLSEWLTERELPINAWRFIGSTIRRFHRAGIYHADLNAHNILLTPAGKTYLIDFDRGRKRRPAKRWQQANLQRLLRSLNKLQSQYDIFYFRLEHWQALQDGYAAHHE